MSKGRRFKASFDISRRDFLATALWGSAVAALPFLSSCSTLDDYLIEDQFDFNQEVIIIGGGIAGLFAAYELKKNKIPFKIFEASSRLGGKIQTVDKVEWGAFEFQKQDGILNSLAKDFSIEKQDLDNKSWTFKKGASALVEELSDVVQGLIPEKQIRLQHQLQSVRKVGSRYQLNFQTPQRERMYFARNVILALPQNIILKIRHLDEIKDVKPILATLSPARNWTNIRVNVLTKDIHSDYKIKSRINEESLRNAFYKMTTQDSAQFFVRQRIDQVAFTFRLATDHPLRPVQHLEALMQKLTSPQFTLTNDNCKDWGGEALDSRARGDIDLKSIPFPTGRLRIISEAFVSISSSKSSIENLLNLTKQEVQFFKLDI